MNPGECSLNTAAAGVPAIHLQADFQTRGTLIACQGAWNLFPRPVASLNPYSQAYASSARDILKSAYCLAVANPAVRKIYRADLDADRQDEVVVLAPGRPLGPRQVVHQAGLGAADSPRAS